MGSPRFTHVEKPIAWNEFLAIRAGESFVSFRLSFPQPAERRPSLDKMCA